MTRAAVTADRVEMLTVTTRVVSLAAPSTGLLLPSVALMVTSCSLWFGGHILSGPA